MLASGPDAGMYLLGSKTARPTPFRSVRFCVVFQTQSVLQRQSPCHLPVILRIHRKDVLCDAKLAAVAPARSTTRRHPSAYLHRCCRSANPMGLELKTPMNCPQLSCVLYMCSSEESKFCRVRSEYLGQIFAIRLESPCRNHVSGGSRVQRRRNSESIRSQVTYRRHLRVIRKIPVSGYPASDFRNFEGSVAYVGKLIFV